MKKRGIFGWGGVNFTYFLVSEKKRGIFGRGGVNFTYFFINEKIGEIW